MTQGGRGPDPYLLPKRRVLSHAISPTPVHGLPVAQSLPLPTAPRLPPSRYLPAWTYRTAASSLQRPAIPPAVVLRLIQSRAPFPLPPSSYPTFFFLLCPSHRRRRHRPPGRLLAASLASSRTGPGARSPVLHRRRIERTRVKLPARGQWTLSTVHTPVTRHTRSQRPTHEPKCRSTAPWLPIRGSTPATACPKPTYTRMAKATTSSSNSRRRPHRRPRPCRMTTSSIARCCGI